MSAKLIKLSDEELATCKLRDITNIVKGKFTDEEIAKLKETTEEKERREFVISLYKKYIDEVIEEANKETSSTDETPDATPTTDADKAQEKDSNDEETEVTATSETKAKDVNINVYFTVSVKGITGYSGTITCSCEHLLKIAFLNPKTAIIEFRTPDRAKQFIDVVKKVEHVKGLSSIPENTRALVINRIKEMNGIK